MATHYVIVDTAHPLWPTIEAGLKNIRWNCIPDYNKAGDKAIVHLKNNDMIPAWVLNHITTGDGVLWAGPLEEMWTQKVVDIKEWADDLEDK